MDFQVRQGDVMIFAAAGADTAGMVEVQLDRGRVVLAHGAVTGHAHAIASSAAKLFRRPGADPHEDSILVLTESARLSHEEHAPIDLPAGTFTVRRQREYHPEEVRYVAD